MEYKPLAAVWEITMGCNMRCKHCGSSCKAPLADQLTTEEALELCKELGEMGLRWVTVSGGEALTRSDWHIIARALTDNGVIPLLITNGWLVDEDVIKKAEYAGIESFAMSIDGVRETHDFIRMPGSFDRIMNAYEMMDNTSLAKAAITTVNKKNIGELSQLKEILKEKGVGLWQLQIGLPMGNLSENSYMALDPEQVEEVIDFAYNTIDDEDITIYLADCLGYYDRREISVREKTFKDKNIMWSGCTAGKRSFGILQNGSILGCTSIRDEKFIEGSIRETPLKDIWGNMQNFSWSRTMSKSKLAGFCNKCGYGDRCLGGCPNTRLTFNNDIYSENKFCLFNIAMQKAHEKITQINDREKVVDIAKKLLERNEFQIAELAFARALELDKDDIDSLCNYGFVNYMLNNYETAKQANERVLNIDQSNVYANKGLGLTLVKLGYLEEGLEYLKKATQMTDENYMYPYYDFALTLIENNRIEDAKSVIKEAKAKTPNFSSLEKSLMSLIEQQDKIS